MRVPGSTGSNARAGRRQAPRVKWGPVWIEELRKHLVVLEDPRFPGYRFQLDLAEDGRIIGWGVFNQRLLRTPGSREPEEHSLEWGPDSPVTARLIRSAPFGHLERVARDESISTYGALASGEWPSELSPAVRRELGLLRKRMAKTRGPGPKVGEVVLDDRHYALVARDYVAELSRSSRSPYPALSEQWNFAPKTIKNWTLEARKRGLLSEPPSPGRAGGHLTDKGKRALRRRARGET